mmetsp:Transcript_15673/g.37194  ORF Transcript_15673/g.37194 Transcript_15673/m.37194 type:complete len:252 (-) Transcript_15673:599-1354(-)
MPEERPQGVAVGHHEDVLLAGEQGHNVVGPICLDSRHGNGQGLTSRQLVHRNLRVEWVVGRVPGVRPLDAFRQNIITASPVLDLIFAVHLDGLLLSKALQHPGMPRVQLPGLGGRQQILRGLAHQLGGPHRPLQDGGEHVVQLHPLLLDEQAGLSGLLLALQTQRSILPAAVNALGVAKALGMAQEEDLVGRRSIYPDLGVEGGSVQAVLAQEDQVVPNGRNLKFHHQGGARRHHLNVQRIFVWYILQKLP